MSRTSNVVWGLIALVAAILAVLGAVYGPRMVREGKALVGPIVDIAKSEERLAELNTKMPFEAPAEGAVAEDRFLVFTEIRRELLPMYMQWQDIERELEKSGQEDWESAMEVLGAIQSVMGAQMTTLESHGMSPAEFVWIEDLVYDTWMEEVAEEVEMSAVDDALRESTIADIERLAEIEARSGRSKSSREFRAHLNQRLDAIENPGPPAVDGIPSETAAMFWEHRDELAALDLEAFSELHRILRGGSNVNIENDGRGSEE